MQDGLLRMKGILKYVKISFHFQIHKYGITLPNDLVRKWKQNAQQPGEVFH